MGIVQPSGEFGKARQPTAVNPEDLRAAPRFTMLIRAAKLVSSRGEFLCVIRDASDTGMSMRIFHRLPKSRDQIVEMQNGDRYEMELVWQEDDRAGFRFLTPIDVNWIIECPSPFSKRPVRLNLTASAQIETLGLAEFATIHDISQQGAKISSTHNYAIDQRVKLCAAGMRDTFAKVRWRRDGMYGLVFDETFQFGELARIARKLQEIG